MQKTIFGVAYFLLLIFSCACNNDNTNIPNAPSSNALDVKYKSTNGVIIENLSERGKKGGVGSQLLIGNSTCVNQKISVSDCDGMKEIIYDDRAYKLMEIGGQCWFAENLATDQYSNGDNIQSGLSDNEWKNSKDGAFAVNQNKPENDEKYGKLYNFYAVVDSRGLCPTGWHVPTDCEWMFLENSFGIPILIQQGSNISRKIPNYDASKDSMNWSDNNLDSVFSNLSSIETGSRNIWGNFELSHGANYWTSSKHEEKYAWYRWINYNSYDISRGRVYEQIGFSVRCIRD